MPHRSSQHRSIRITTLMVLLFLYPGAYHHAMIYRYHSESMRIIRHLKDSEDNHDNVNDNDDRDDSKNIKNEYYYLYNPLAADLLW